MKNNKNVRKKLEAMQCAYAKGDFDVVEKIPELGKNGAILFMFVNKLNRHHKTEQDE